MQLIELGLTSANKVQEAWTVAFSRVQGDWGTAYFGKHSLRVKGDGYNILHDFAEYEPDFDVDESVPSARSHFLGIHSAPVCYF